MGQYLDDSARTRLLDITYNIKNDYTRFIGFPAVLDYDLEDLMPIMQLFMNNLGDPTDPPLWHLHSKEIECEVVAFFAKLFRGPAGKTWGYVTNGSTECNLYALYAAREKYPGAKVYYSESAHYSVPKNIHILGLTGVPVHALPSGEMEYGHLSALLHEQAGAPAIVVATIGSTMTESRDDVAMIRTMLRQAGVKDYYIHADAALAGAYSALLSPRWPFDFKDGADSVSVSGHKFIGSPMPCGVIIIKTEHKERLTGQYNYTGTPDTTISGSRNGHTPFILWHAIQRWGKSGFRQRALDGLALAEYAEKTLGQIGWECWRNPQALTVMLRSPSVKIIRKWQLATYQGWSHIICMPGVTKDRLDSFAADLALER